MIEILLLLILIVLSVIALMLNNIDLNLVIVARASQRNGERITKS